MNNRSRQRNLCVTEVKTTPIIAFMLFQTFGSEAGIINNFTTIGAPCDAKQINSYADDLSTALFTVMNIT